MPTEERRISVAELFEAYEQGRLTEAFGTGTAAVISPVGELAYHDRSMILNGGKIGPVAQEMYDCLVGIQRGERPGSLRLGGAHRLTGVQSGRVRAAQDRM